MPELNASKNQSLIGAYPVVSGWRAEQMEAKDYKTFLINNILEWQTGAQFTREQLEEMTIRALEIIHDNI